MFDNIFLFFPQIVSYFLLVIVGITALEHLTKHWHFTNMFEIKTPVSVAKGPHSFQYYTSPRISNWTYEKNQLYYEQEFQTPIQRIPEMRRMGLKHRAKIMTGVRRRLDQQF